MYRACIFCSADLGSNDSLETFPVGGSLAFDAWRGRLWAVCPGCARWNLAPIEERWEATEAAEKLFRDARLRAQSENVGLAKLRDGTRLIRIGEALPGELAAWRYGDQLVSRRRRNNLAFGATAGVVVLLASAPYLLPAAGVSTVAGSLLFNAWNVAHRYRRGQRVVHRFGAADSPTGEPLELRRFQLNGTRVEESGDGDVALHLPNALASAPHRQVDGRTVWSIPCLTIRGPAARKVLGRAMVDANAAGASRRSLDRALELLGKAGSADEYLHSVATRQAALPLAYVTDYRRRLDPQRVVGRLRGDVMPREVRPDRTRLPEPESLALEMALHEATERRALEGELAALEAAWREAEEIAAIADVLPDDPLDRLGRG